MKQLLLLLILPLFLLAQPNGQRNREKMGQALREQLQLSDTQVEQLKEVRIKHQSEMRPLRRELRENRELLILSYNDQKKCEEIARTTGNLHRDLTLLMAKQMRDISTILTEEQHKKFIELKSKRKSKRRR